MSALQKNLSFDFGPEPEDALKAAFAAQDFGCVAALLKAGVPLSVDGRGLQRMLIAVEEGAALDEQTAQVISQAIYHRYKSHDLCDYPFARNAVYAFCKQAINEAPGADTGMLHMGRALLNDGFKNPEALVTNTAFEACVDDLLDVDHPSQLKAYVRTLNDFSTVNPLIDVVADQVAERVGGVRLLSKQVNDSTSLPVLSNLLVQILVMALTTQEPELQLFKCRLRDQLWPSRVPETLALDLLLKAKDLFMRKDFDAIASHAYRSIDRALNVDQKSSMIDSPEQLRLMEELGFATAELNKSLFKPSVLTNILEIDLGL
jgi:hypothetical protein